ncbi:uncharacterized protein LOC128297462 isoform X3 [Anopheles moucheti]|uniref:uncharacterized protein LOC128297462 isoform X3 n=1 Tax=Anopheles moucheti TaxID=186751 RepID=UPI0022F03460|nr:uncharacterized protein LOC128297462 isoform X3 [Anopheles moucheti]
MESLFEGFCTGGEILTKHADRWRKISFGVPVFDRLTGGGISCRGIFELAGDPGSGFCRWKQNINANILTTTRYKRITLRTIYLWNMFDVCLL